MIDWERCSYQDGGGIIFRRDYYNDFLQNPKISDWGWLLAFASICMFNGWLLYTSQRAVNITIVYAVIFAIFPLACLVYELVKNPWVLNISLLISWLVIAFAIGNLEIKITAATIILYLINLFIFAIVLQNILRETGYLLLVLFAVVMLFLFRITDWEKSLRLIWFCNLMFSANHAGSKLGQYFQSFPKGMFLLSAIASLGITCGWLLASRLG